MLTVAQTVAEDGRHRAASWLIRDVEVGGDNVDCQVTEGMVTALGPRLEAPVGTLVLDGRGGALLPGLADHHLHLRAAAAARHSYDLRGGTDLSALSELTGAGWLRVIGAGAPLSRADVDRACSSRPVRVQHRSGAVWTLNSAGVDLLRAGLTGEEARTGQLWRSDGRLRRLLGGTVQSGLGELGKELAARGVTHVTDATPDLDDAAVAGLRHAIPQNVLALGSLGGPGPRKLVVADHDLAASDTLNARIAAAHEAGRPVAVHCVTQVALALTIAALDTVGALPGDRIEHAAVCDDAAADRLAEHGVTIVTQSTLFARHGRRYLADTDPADRDHLWRHAGLLARGLAVALSSDGPYGDLDPWHTVAAAVTRRTHDGIPFLPDEAVTPRVALGSLLASPSDPAGAQRAVRTGAVADLCLLADPLGRALAQAVTAPDTVGVRATFVAGRPVHLDDTAIGRPAS
ncbi:MAG: amidohydrolase [Streptosporangiaceae bacterium]|nr:amidohydrolase [Streptosporangiaceae bacterium]